jgi:proton-dependent oligopeptide transporter, POT family
MIGRSQQGLFGHPKGLFILFLTEMWERFSYYGMRALLVYYMIKQLTFSQSEASHIYGLYTGLVYLTPVFGGMLADRLLGQRNAVIIGGVLMAMGHFAMASESLFFVALGLLIIGNGFFKPNISSQVGRLYSKRDPRRDRAFSIFYVGINLGAFFSPLVCGTLGERYGWHYGFGMAGVGMLAALSIYLLGQEWLPREQIGRRTKAEPNPAEAPEVPRRKRNQETVLPDQSHPVEPDEGSRVWGLVAICMVTVAFWAAYEQQGNTIALWADADTDRNMFGWEFPASWFQSVNPFLIFVCTPLITKLWSWQAAKGTEPTAGAKMAIGCFLQASSFLVMVIAAKCCGGPASQASMMWLLLFTLLITLGELYLSPVGLSLVTKLSPPHMVSMMMGVWFCAAFFGNYAAGYLGSHWERMPREHFFLMMAGIAFVAGLALLLILSPLRQAVGKEYDV